MPIGARIPMQAATRAAAVQLLRDYAAEAEIKLQVYRARPASIHPPAAFVDSMSESLTSLLLPATRERRPRASIVVVHGLFDSGDAADQRDAFVDGFLDWCIERFDAIDENAIAEVVSVEDMPAWVPEWVQPSSQRTYYATELVLEGQAGT